jgi:16S rRNA (cytosine1402-N4)-methyltransferase
MHEPVLTVEVVSLLALRPGAVCVDATAGSGGHALEILRRIQPGGRLLGIDRDKDAVERARARLSGVEGLQWDLVHSNYARLGSIAGEKGIPAVDAVLIDCGISSEQLQTAERGFSFQANGPLDMRMDRSQPGSAADVVNQWAEADLARLLWDLGDEPAARRIARGIVQAREGSPIRETAQLASLVERAAGGRRGPTHPATRTFQALRMAVNQELESLKQALEAAIGLLRMGGRLAVITFHSGEDRLVKHLFREHEGQWESLEAGGRVWRGAKPAVRRVNRKPVVPSDEELKRNPRARSAKLRVVERVEEEGR